MLDSLASYVINLPVRIASNLRQKYRQGARHGIDTRGREGGVDITAQVLREHPELMVALAAMDAAGNAGEVPAAAGETPSLSRNVTSGRREGMTYPFRSGSASSSSSAQSALSPFAANLGYNAWSPREKPEAVVQRHEQQRRLRLHPHGSISSDADSDSTHYETNSQGTMRNSMPLLRASSGPLRHNPPQPLAIHERGNSGPVGGSTRGGDRTALGSSFPHRGQTNDGVATRGGTGSVTDSSTVEMATAMSRGVRDLMGHLLRASSLRSNGGSRVGGGDESESIPHSGNVHNGRDSARSTREERVSAEVEEGRVADNV